MLLHPTPSMEPPFFMQASMETRRSHQYLEWKMKIKHVFSCNDYEETQKVKLATSEFFDYGLVWWNKLQMERARNELVHRLR